MTTGMGRLGEQLRRIARQEVHKASPPARKFRVVKLSPFTVEALGSDARLVQGEDNFEIGRAVLKEAAVGDTCLVTTDGNGEHTAHGLI